MPDALTYDDALALLRRAVEEKGADHVYRKRGPQLDDDGGFVSGSGCMYFDPEDHYVPACIIGHVFSYLGLGYHDLPHGCNNLAITGLINDRGMLVTDEYAQLLFEYAQDLQDLGRPWGQAVTEADEKINGHRTREAESVTA